MTNAPAAFSATYSDWKLVRGRKVVQIVFEVPIEGAGQVHDVLGGMPDPSKSVWCAIARMNSESEVMPDQYPSNGLHKPQPDPVTDNVPGRASKSWHEMSPAQQAGIRCNEPSFWRFLGETYEEYRNVINDASAAASTVRDLCGVASRSDIRRGEPSGYQWGRLDSAYRAWMQEPGVVP